MLTVHHITTITHLFRALHGPYTPPVDSILCYQISHGYGHTSSWEEYYLLQYTHQDGSGLPSKTNPETHAPIRTTGQAPKSILNPREST